MVWKHQLKKTTLSASFLIAVWNQATAKQSRF